MRDGRSKVWLSALLLLLAVAAVSASQGHSRARTTGAQRTTPALRASDGRPDLQGIWNFSSVTMLERPGEFAGKEFVTGAEAAALQKLVQTAAATTEATDACYKVGYNPDDFFEDAVHGEGRGQKVLRLPTSLIVDPPDGRLPPLTPLGQKRTAASIDAFMSQQNDGPESRSLGERCL